MPMNSDYKAPWIAALRSGDYKQANGRLYDGDGYCCLGVLCKVAGSQFSLSGYKNERYNAGPISGYNVASGECLSAEGRALFGIALEEHDKLTAMNDGSDSEYDCQVQSFSQIADWIEENL